MTAENTSRDHPAPMEIGQVVEACARQFGVTVEFMREKRRARNLMMARYMAAHICMHEVHNYRLWKVKQEQGEHSGYWIASRVIFARIKEELAALLEKDHTSIRWFNDRACEMLEKDAGFRKKREAIIAELENWPE